MLLFLIHCLTEELAHRTPLGGRTTPWGPSNGCLNPRAGTPYGFTRKPTAAPDTVLFSLGELLRIVPRAARHRAKRKP